MFIEKSRISNLLLMYLISGYIMGNALLVSFMDSISFHDSWLVMVTAYFVSVPIVLSYIVLIQKFPGKGFMQILELTYGSYIGKFISLLYCLFFFWLFILNTRKMGDFYSSLIMPETPQLVFILIFALICAYAVKSGIEVIARMSPLIVFFCVMVVASTFLLLLPSMDFTELLPILEIPMGTYVHSTHIIVAIFFGELIACLMALPTSNEIQKLWKFTFWGLTLSAVTFVAIAIRNTAVLGAASSIYIDASYQAVRHIDMGGFFTRIEILVGIAITISLFIKASVLLYAVILSISQLLRLSSLSTLILPIVGIAIVIANNVHESSVSEFNDAVNYYPFLSLPFTLIFPLLALVLAQIRKLPKQQGGERK